MAVARITRSTFVSGLAAVPLAAAAAGPTYKVGTILSVTGPGGFLGDNMKRGAQLAVDEINAGSGINGKKIDWIFYDAETQSTKGVTAARRLIEQDGVDIIVGGGNASGIALAIVPVVEKASVPFISTEGAMAIVNPVAERAWTFKSTIDDDIILDRAADWWTKRGTTSIALLHDTSGFGQSAKEQLAKVAERRKLRVVYESFDPADTDLTAQLGRIKQTDAKVVLCWTIAPSGVVFLKQAAALGLSDRTIMNSYGFVDERYMKLAEGAAEGTYLLSTKFPVGADLPAKDSQKNRILALTKSYESRYNSKPNQFVAQTYDAINLAAQALKSGGNDRPKVRAALEGIKGYPGVNATFSFSPTRHSGLNKTDAVIIVWKNGDFHLADYE